MERFTLKFIFGFCLLFDFSEVLANGGDSFEDCHTYVNENGLPDNAKPKDSPTLYEIVSEYGQYPSLKAIKEVPSGDENLVFRVVNENARFETYKCWTSPENGKMLSGFDVQLMTELLALTSYKYIQFIEIPWQTTVAPQSPISVISETCRNILELSKNEIEADSELLSTFNHCLNNKEVEFQLSLFTKINLDQGDAALAGMSITKERLQWAPLVGPIYKAGKLLVAAKTNATVLQKKKDLLSVPDSQSPNPCDRYEALRGLQILESSANIRGEFLLSLHKSCPALVDVKSIAFSMNDGIQDPNNPSQEELEFKEKNITKIRDAYQSIKNQLNAGKLTFIDIPDYPLIEEFVNSGLVKDSHDIFDAEIDLVMIDSGSAHSLKMKNILDNTIEVVSGDLSSDTDLGKLFGLGDGIAVKQSNTANFEILQNSLMDLVANGTIDRLVKRWFNDNNFADPNCIENVELCL